MAFAQIQALLSSEIQAMNEAIIRCLESQVEVINKISHYLIESGGKRVRPLVVLLSSKACSAPLEKAISMAAIIEFIHSATLLHDDVVDDSKLRRGRLTANRVWDNPTAILVGDFLYSRSFQMLVTINNMECMRILADTTNIISEGEVLQLAHRFEADLDEARYFKVIQYKTAQLFEAAAQLGPVLAKEPVEVQQALAAYGKHLGIAFQLVDDVLDYQATNESWGKNIGSDLSEGKATLPLIYALKHASKDEADLIRNAIITGSTENIELIQKAIVSCGAVDYTMKKAQNEVAMAIDALKILPPSEYKDAMAKLAEFAIKRIN